MVLMDGAALAGTAGSTMAATSPAAALDAMSCCLMMWRPPAVCVASELPLYG
jgi:hypothetical protein